MADELFADEIALNPPPEWSTPIKDKLDRHYNALIRVSNTTFELGAELPDDVRADFVSRETILVPALAARNQLAVAHAVKGMLDTFMARPIAEKSIKCVAYTRALEKFPPWAARQACWRFVCGEEPRRNKEWAPGPDVLTQATVNVMLPFSVELLKLSRVLRAHPHVKIDPAASERMRFLIKQHLTNRRSDVRAKNEVMIDQARAMRDSLRKDPPNGAGQFEEF